jgi:hypothetical protein
MPAASVFVTRFNLSGKETPEIGQYGLELMRDNASLMDYL